MGLKAVLAVIVLAPGFARDGLVEPAFKGFRPVMGPRCAWAGEPVFHVTGLAKPVHRMGRRAEPEQCGDNGRPTPCRYRSGAPAP